MLTDPIVLGSPSYRGREKRIGCSDGIKVDVGKVQRIMDEWLSFRGDNATPFPLSVTITARPAWKHHARDGMCKG